MSSRRRNGRAASAKAKVEEEKEIYYRVTSGKYKGH